MNGYQLMVLTFALLVAALSISAIWSIARAPELRRKWLWISGSLCGTLGLGMDWTHPDDLVLLFGVTIPVVAVFKVVPSGQVIVKTGFPVFAVVALWKINSAPANAN